MRFIGIIVEQGLIGVGNFLVSWMALRYLASDRIALFAVVWSISWGAFAVISEMLITPLRVQMATSGKQDSLALIRAGATSLSGLLLIASLALVFFQPLGESFSLILVALGIPTAAIAFYSARSMDVESGSPKRMMRRGAVYATCSFVFLVLVSETAPSTGLYPIVACLALLVGSLDRGTKWRLTSATARRAYLLARRTAWVNRSFGISTALRVTLFSSGLLLFLGLTSGNQSVAVYAATFVLISPIQLASSTLPWLMLSRQARIIGDRKKFISEMLLQLAVYLLLGLLASLVLALIWDWWTVVSISDLSVLEAVSGSLVGVLALMNFMLLTSWSSSLTQILKLRRAQLFAVVAGGIGGFVVVFMRGEVIVAALMPYFVSLTVASAFIIWKVKAIGKC